MGERKILICSQAPEGAAPGAAGPATMTRPSAGASTARPACSSSGGDRSGSRKKNAKNPASATKSSAGIHPKATPSTSASTSAPPMNGRPAGSRRMIDKESGGRAGGRARKGIGSLSVRVRLAVPAQDVFHPVFQLQLALFEGDFFDLFWFREVLLGGQLVQSIFQLVLPGREVVKLLVGPQQLGLQIVRLCI